MGAGIGANAPKNKLAGVLMVGALVLLRPPDLFSHLHYRPVSLHLEESCSVMIPVPSLVSSRCPTGFALLVTLLLSHRPFLTASASLPLKGPSSYLSFPPVLSLVSDTVSFVCMV